jgi:AraC-like DNA-binding protein
VATDTVTTHPHQNVFDTTDPGHTEAFLTNAYGMSVKFSGRQERNYRFRHVQFGPGPFYLNSVRYTASAEFHTDVYPELSVVRMHRGVRTRLDIDHELCPGDLALHGPLGEPAKTRCVNAGYTIVIVPLQAAAEAARNRPDDALGPLRFASLRPSSAAAAQLWLHTITYITDNLRANPDAMAQRLLIGSTTRLLASTLLTTFPNSWIREPDYRDRLDTTTTTLSRAIAFMETNADLDISIVDVARAAYVTVRAVQLAFRRHHDTTPMAYLRRVRLDRIHERLRDAHPGDGTTIANVAATWGFADPSRFSALYRRTYGQPPSQTLRN